jgi:hypothetical protein
MIDQKAGLPPSFDFLDEGHTAGYGGLGAIPCPQHSHTARLLREHVESDGRFIASVHRFEIQYRVFLFLRHFRPDSKTLVPLLAHPLDEGVDTSSRDAFGEAETLHTGILPRQVDLVGKLMESGARDVFSGGSVQARACVEYRDIRMYAILKPGDRRFGCVVETLVVSRPRILRDGSCGNQRQEARHPQNDPGD